MRGPDQRQKTVWGIVEWALEHASELIACLDLPSRSTFYVTLRKIGIEELERQIGEVGTAMAWSWAKPRSR